MNEDHYEYMHPYHIKCVKHGEFDSQYDECEQCIEETSREAEDRFYARWRLCFRCQNFDGEHCTIYPYQHKGRKNHCKYFQKLTEKDYIDAMEASVDINQEREEWDDEYGSN